MAKEQGNLMVEEDKRGGGCIYRFNVLCCLVLVKPNVGHIILLVQLSPI